MDNWQKNIKDNALKISLSLILLIFALYFNHISSNYTTRVGSSSTTDIILDNIGPYNLSFIFIWFSVIVVVLFFGYPLIFNPKKLHYSITMFSFFYIVRSIFISFTHLKAPVDAVVTNFPFFLKELNFSNDLFFSGHTGLPFLGFLIFEENKLLRYFMLFSSILLGITVLLMHVHYSIDVFSAFFITYGIYKIGNWSLNGFKK